MFPYSALWFNGGYIFKSVYRGLVSDYRKLQSLRSCSSSLVIDILFVPKTLRTRGQTSNMLFDPTVRNVNPFLIRTGIRTMRWPSLHEFPSLLGRDLPFHLKSAWVPKLTETMSFASPHFPNSGSSSLCHPTCEDCPR